MIKKFLLFICALIVGIGIYYYISHFSMYEAAAKHENYFVNTMHDDTIRIAYIGDSWAFLHSMHKCIIDSLVNERTGFQVQVRSAGVNGMTSKDIYESLFNKDSIKEIIKWSPNYCLIVAGINDTDLKLGESFYVANMQLIIDFMQENNIIPIILEIPHYDIIKSFKDRSTRNKISKIFSMIITSSKLDCIDSYRDAFDNKLMLEYGKVIYIKEQDWSPQGFKDSRGIYTDDMMHLNDKGYNILDSCIASHISEDIMMM